MSEETGQKQLRPDEGQAAERFHMWSARPLLRSIRWDPVPAVSPPELEGAYDVFIMQGALENLLDHVWSAAEGDTPFGLLAGDICEDPDDGTRYVLISAACRSRVSLSENATILPEAWETLNKDLEEQRIQGSLVGWYLRHPSGSLKLTEAERETHARYFNEPWHSVLVVGTEPDQPAGGLFRRTARGFSAVPLPFHEVVTTESLTGGNRRSVLDWANIDAEVDVNRDPSWREGGPSTAGRPGRSSGRPGRGKEGDASGPAGPIAQEAARRAIAAAASRTAADLDVRRREAEELARQADEAAARKAEELQA
ncbi:MAG: hypothetical protein ACODAB_01350, partial [Gemmatimonadota bacterium]